VNNFRNSEKYRIKKIFDGIVFMCLFSMVGLVFINAGARYIFNSSLPISEELSRYLFIWVSFLGTVTAFKDNKHVGVTLFVERFKGKAKVLLEFIGDIFILLALTVVLYGGILYMQVTYNTISPASGIPFGFVAVSIVLASFSMIMICLLSAIKKIKVLTRKEV